MDVALYLMVICKSTGCIYVLSSIKTISCFIEETYRILCFYFFSVENRQIDGKIDAKSVAVQSCYHH